MTFSDFFFEKFQIVTSYFKFPYYKFTLFSPNEVAFFRQRNIIIATPVGTGASVGAVGVAGAVGDALDVVGAALGFAVLIAVTLLETNVGLVSTLVSALFSQ